MYLARVLVAISALSAAAHAEETSPQGIWAAADTSCGRDSVFIHATGRVWEFSDAAGATRVQFVVRQAGRDVITRSEGSDYAYHFDSPTSVRVTDLWTRHSFTLVRCPVDALLGPEELKFE